jgi:hypothetical protein
MHFGRDWKNEDGIVRLYINNEILIITEAHAILGSYCVRPILFSISLIINNAFIKDRPAYR